LVKEQKEGEGMIVNLTSFLKSALLPTIRKLLSNQFENFFLGGKRRKLYKSWKKQFKRVFLNARLSEKKFDDSNCSKMISNLLFQSTIKGYPFSNKDLVLILAKENCWGLSSADIINLVTTFCDSLRPSLKKVNRTDLFIDEVYIELDLSEPTFVQKINNYSGLNKEYYKHFSNRGRNTVNSDMKINVHFRDELGVTNRTSNYSVDVSINRFDVSEICSGFFTADAEYVLCKGTVREQVKFVHMDKKGNVKIVLENESSYGACSKKYVTLWEV